MYFDKGFFTIGLHRCFSFVKQHFVSSFCGIAVFVSLTVSVFAEPVITSFEAKLDGENVIQVPPNSAIKLTAVAEDPNGGLLSFIWSTNSGVIIPSSGPETEWQLPISRGLHFAYVRVTDSNGNYVDRGVTVSTDGSAIFGSQAVPKPTASDGIPKSDHFLSYSGITEEAVSCEYYLAIGTGGECINGKLSNPELNLTKWKDKWGLNDPSSGVRAIYANKADLNLQRNMHGISSIKGIAYYVCNYPRVDDLDEGANLDNAIYNLNLAACVAMEKGDDNITKFYAFGPSGDLLQSVNLDGRGEKYIPGSCVVCHGGFLNQPLEADLKSNFLPFDLDNLVFSGDPGLTKLEQQKSLRQLNQWIREKEPVISDSTDTIDPNENRTAIAKLIDGWYSDPNIAFKSDFVPEEWQNNRALYENVVKPHCRTCHIALNTSFTTFNSFADRASSIDKFVCGNPRDDHRAYKMPNALVTFNRFWDSPAAIEALKNFLLERKNSGDPISGECNSPQ